jgi:hypothetical protein
MFRTGLMMWARCATYMGVMGSEYLFEGEPERNYGTFTFQNTISQYAKRFDFYSKIQV